MRGHQRCILQGLLIIATVIQQLNTQCMIRAMHHRDLLRKKIMLCLVFRISSFIHLSVLIRQIYQQSIKKKLAPTSPLNTALCSLPPVGVLTFLRKSPQMSHCLIMPMASARGILLPLHQFSFQLFLKKKDQSNRLPKLSKEKNTPHMEQKSLPEYKFTRNVCVGTDFPIKA